MSNLHRLCIETVREEVKHVTLDFIASSFNDARREREGLAASADGVVRSYFCRTVSIWFKRHGNAVSSCWRFFGVA